MTDRDAPSPLSATIAATFADGGSRFMRDLQLQTTFERGVPEDIGTVTFEAYATKTGRSLVFGQIDLMLPDGRRAATATTTYMWL